MGLLDELQWLYCDRICCVNEAHRLGSGKINQVQIGEIPEKPKKPGNAFLQYVKEMETKIFSDNPDVSRRGELRVTTVLKTSIFYHLCRMFLEMVRMASKMWRDSDSEIKNRFQNIFAEKNKEYERKLALFNKRLTAEQKSVIAQLEETALKKKEKLKNRQV